MFDVEGELNWTAEDMEMPLNLLFPLLIKHSTTVSSNATSILIGIVLKAYMLLYI